MTVIDVHNHVVPAKFPVAGDPGVASSESARRFLGLQV
jgi:hypothetical protein